MQITLKSFRETTEDEAHYFLERICEERNNPETKKVLRSYRDTVMCLQKNFYNKIIQDDTCEYYFITRESPGISNIEEILGYCGIDKIHPVNKTAELSILIFKDFQEQGIGKESVRQLISKAFDEFNLNLIFVETYDMDTRLLFFQSCGFNLEGRLKKRKFTGGEYFDSFMLSMERGGYENNNP